MMQYAKRSGLALVACVSLIRAPDGQSPSPLFVHAQPVAVGPGSGQILLLDLDRDGRLDMVTRHLLQRKLGVLLGDGRGGFAAATPIALDYQPGWIAAADVNGDAIADLVSTNSERDDVDVFLGDGKGGFARADGSPFAASPSREFFTRGLELLDVNEDRRMDIVTTNGRDNTFGILLGNGRGGFAPGPVVRRASANEQRHVFAFGDVDGDGHADAVVATRVNEESSAPERTAMLQGNGKGAFTDMTTTLPLPPGANSMTFADVNGDSRVDLVSTHANTRLLSVLLNDGGGRFTPATGSPLNIGDEAFGVIVADANGDGRPDLLAGTAATATVLLGDGRGKFTPAPGSPFRTGPGTYRISAGDINGDGKLDLAAPSFEGNSVAILLGR